MLLTVFQPDVGRAGFCQQGNRNCVDSWDCSANQVKGRALPHRATISVSECLKSTR